MFEFTVAIPTLKSRASKLLTLLGELYGQIAANDFGEAVEILTYMDDKQRSIGVKRNWLLQNARGRFMAFIDDDDRVDNSYLFRVVSALRDHPDVDVLGLTGSMGTFTTRGVLTSRGRQRFVHSLKYRRYYTENNVMYRCPNHLNPMRTEIAKQFDFQDSSFGEDTDWAMRICKAEVLKKEHFLQGSPLYYYDYVPDKKN